MNSPEQTPESRPARDRRVGTFTFGAVLVICGALMGSSPWKATPSAVETP